MEPLEVMGDGSAGPAGGTFGNHPPLPVNAARHPRMTGTLSLRLGGPVEAATALLALRARLGGR